MRHRIAGKKFSLNRKKRKALFKNLINSLVIYGRVKTTESRARAIKRIVEKLITKGKERTLHSRRLIGAFLQNNKAVNKIVDELGPLFKKRPGGYTRIVKLNKRNGDNAPVVRLELVETPPSSSLEKKEIKKTKKDENKNKTTKKK